MKETLKRSLRVIRKVKNIRIFLFASCYELLGFYTEKLNNFKLFTILMFCFKTKMVTQKTLVTSLKKTNKFHTLLLLSMSSLFCNQYKYFQNITMKEKDLR